METELFGRETSEILVKLPAGTRVGIIGSTSFWHRESGETCTALGRELAALDGVVLITGGVEGVGEAVGRSFWVARGGGGKGRPHIFHILPHGSLRWDYGETLFGGSDMEERREILARLAGIYVAVEGGPGTAHETSIALARSAFVVPVGRSWRALSRSLSADPPTVLRCRTVVAHTRQCRRSSNGRSGCSHRHRSRVS